MTPTPTPGPATATVTTGPGGPGHDPELLRRWMDARVDGGLDGPLRSRLIAGGRSNPTYEVADDHRSWVLRRPPHGHVLPTAHDMAREFRVINALRGTAVPVPLALGLCTDRDVLGADFYVMEKLDGVTLRTREDTARLSAEQRRLLAERMVDTLVALHQVEPADVGLADWGRPDGFLDRQLRRWRQQWEASVTAPRPQVEELLRRLTDSRPARSLPGVVHGDFKVDNLMVGADDPTRVLGVLDWEMSTLGDTLTDLGLLCSFWDQPGELYNPITAGATALPGFPSRVEVIERYAAARDLDLDDLDWYLVFADLKIAVILEGIHARHLQGHTEGSDFADVGAMVGPLLDRALAAASASAVPGLHG